MYFIPNMCVYECMIIMIVLQNFVVIIKNKISETY